MKTRIGTALLALLLAAPLAAQSQISVSIAIAPPPLPVYEQPLPPADGYLWTPGYWAWNDAGGGYYWVPGTWVRAPRPGYLWTPGYWAFGVGGYRWHAGYWGLRVGFYGGIDYGFGYTGHGYYGGRWERGVFHYNAAVNNVNTTVVHNVYRTTVVNKTYNVTRVSYNGGATGVKAQPTAAEVQVQHEQHLAATQAQIEHRHKALEMPAQRASVNHGAPQVAATAKPAAFSAPNAVKPSHKAAVQTPAANDKEAKQRQAAPVQAKAAAHPPTPHDRAERQAPGEPKAARGSERPPVDSAQRRHEHEPQGGAGPGNDVKQARAPREPAAKDRQAE